jgi:hypothetical protein
MEIFKKLVKVKNKMLIKKINYCENKKLNKGQLELIKNFTIQMLQNHYINRCHITVTPIRLPNYLYSEDHHMQLPKT